MKDKKQSRLRRARRGRMKMREIGAVRLSVHRTPRHMYAQVIAPAGDKVLATASTLEKDLRGGSNRQCRRRCESRRPDCRACQSAGVTRVAFDRSGFKYHGRVKALAEAAREGGLEF